MRQTLLLRWLRWTTGALLLPIIAIPIMAAAQGRQPQLPSTAWSPFTNASGQPLFALDLVGVRLDAAAHTLASLRPRPVALPDAQSIISRFNAKQPGMIAARSYHRLLHLDSIRTDGDGRT